MWNIDSYEEQIKSFEWPLAEKELEHVNEDIINIG
jgi:hypothetical protein